MKQYIIFLFCLVYSAQLSSQEHTGPDYNIYEYSNVNTGYSLSFGDPNEGSFHILDIGINKTRYGGRHGGGFQYGIGSEIVLNAESFTIGPKISGTMYYQFLAFGADIVTYTDFDNWTLRLAPFIGIGGNKVKLTINPHVILTNKNFQPIDRGLVNLSINLTLKRKLYKTFGH